MPTDVTILVVDDEPPLLRLMQSFLQRLGYRVEAFATATEALRRFELTPDAFGAVITDLTLPDLPGQELGLAMLKINPAVYILLCSGYPFEIDSLPPDARRSFAHLQKPFLPKMLASKLEELLGRRAA